jgi:hypothetical protein
MKILISKQGEIKFIYTDELVKLSQLDNAVIERVSNVEPCKGGWHAQMKDGNVLGPFPTRTEALQQEVLYLEKQMFGGKLGQS